MNATTETKKFNCEHCEGYFNAGKDNCKSCGFDLNSFNEPEDDELPDEHFKCDRCNEIKHCDFYVSLDNDPTGNTICGLCIKDYVKECGYEEDSDEEDIEEEVEVEKPKEEPIKKMNANNLSWNEMPDTHPDKIEHNTITAEVNKMVKDNKMTKDDIKKYIVENFGAEWIKGCSKSTKLQLTNLIVEARIFKRFEKEEQQFIDAWKNDDFDTLKEMFLAKKNKSKINI
jgi:hypothetical protein